MGDHIVAHTIRLAGAPIACGDTARQRRSTERLYIYMAGYARCAYASPVGEHLKQYPNLNGITK